MMKAFIEILSLIILCGLITSCIDKYSREDHSRTTKLTDHLYIETYIVSGQGAFGTDLVSQYLTDSSSFRKYTGTFDEGPEYIYYRVSGDTVYLEKHRSAEGKEPNRLLEKSFLTISELKKINNYR